MEVILLAAAVALEVQVVLSGVSALVVLVANTRSLLQLVAALITLAVVEAEARLAQTEATAAVALARLVLGRAHLVQLT